MITCSYQSSSLHFFFFLILLGLASTSATFLSNDVFEPPRGRSLLQAKQSCPVNFENQNYTIITSKCKGPNYPPKICCDAFKEFACPFAEAISDLKTDCASTMFSYINIYGKYPPGLFSSQCREGKEGLDCTSIAAEPPKPNTASTTTISASATHLPLTAAFLATIVFPFLLSCCCCSPLG